MRKLWLATMMLCALAAGARAQPYAMPLLTNASASGAVQGVPAGDYRVWASGTFAGASIALVASDGGSSTTLATVTGPTAASTRVCIGAGELVQAVVIGGSPAGLNLVLAGDGPCVPAGTGGGTGTVAQGNGGSSAWVVAPTAQAPALPGSDTDFTPVTVGTSSTTVIPAATTSPRAGGDQQ